MGRFKALSFATLLAVGAAQAAQAADLLPPPLIEAPPLRGAVVEDSGFYLRVDAGLANTNAYDLRSTYGVAGVAGATEGSASVGDSGLLGLGAGYQFNSWFRADVTGEYRTSVAYRSNVNAQWGSSVTTATNYNQYGCSSDNSTYCADDYSAQVKTGLFLANAYLDMGTWYGFTPYVGGGVGVAVYEVSGLKDTTTFAANPGGVSAFGYGPANVGTNFAWALMAGTSYHITPNLLLDVGYRYVNMGSFKTGVIACNNTTPQSGCPSEIQHFNVASNDVRVGLRWLAAAPVYSEQVVRAKY